MKKLKLWLAKKLAEGFVKPVLSSFFLQERELFNTNIIKALEEHETLYLVIHSSVAEPLIQLMANGKKEEGFKLLKMENSNDEAPKH